jgi:hypothetical protein
MFGGLRCLLPEVLNIMLALSMILVAIVGYILSNINLMLRVSYITKKFIPLTYFSAHAAMPRQQAHRIM